MSSPLSKYFAPDPERLAPTCDNTLSAKLFCTMGFVQLVGRLRRAQRAWAAGERGDDLRDRLRGLSEAVDEELREMLEEEK